MSFDGNIKIKWDKGRKGLFIKENIIEISKILYKANCFSNNEHE